MYEGQFRLLWDHCEVTLAIYEGDFETRLGYFGVTLGSCVCLVGPKIGNTRNNNKFSNDFSRVNGGAAENEPLQGEGFARTWK